MNWTPEQEEIFRNARAERSLCVNALAGSGKTTTLCEALRNLEPKAGENVLCIAFNASIKRELEGKVPSSVTCLTFNGLGHRAWAGFLGRKLELDTKKNFLCLKEALGPTEQVDKDDFVSMSRALSTAKLLGLVPQSVQKQFHTKPGLPDADDSWERILLEEDLPFTSGMICVLRRALVLSIKLSFKGQIDFDDQIYMPLCFGAPFPHFHTVLVDEAQDISPANEAQILSIQPKRLILFGDRHQSIYAFRGADPAAMDRLAQRFNALELPLNITFRCPIAVCDEVRTHVPEIQPREGAPQGSVKTLDEWSLEQLPTHCAILCRNNAPLFRIASRLIRVGRIPKMLGKGFDTGLKKILKKHIPSTVSGTSLQEAVRAWAEQEIAGTLLKAKKLRVSDQMHCLLNLSLSNPTATPEDLTKIITALFSEDNHTSTVLGTGHKSKGLEWPVVFHLDSFLLGAEDSEQEANLLYVITTRAKEKLFYITTKGLLE